MVKNPPANARDAGLIPGLGKSPGRGIGNALQPGKFHGQRNLVGYSPCHKESDTTESLRTHIQLLFISICPSPGLFHSGTIGILEQTLICYGMLSCEFSSIPSFYPLDASSTPSYNQKYLQMLTNVPCELKITPVQTYFLSIYLTIKRKYN